MDIKNHIRFISGIFFLLFINCACHAQFTNAMIGVNGLTCSACTRTVEMSIRKLDFVKDVDMNLEHTEGKIVFVENSEVDISKIAKAVTDAGFSVRYLNASYNFSATEISNDYCFSTGKFNLQFLNTGDKKINGETMLKFLGKAFLSKNEFNKVKSQLISHCKEQSEPTYFVTL